MINYENSHNLHTMEWDRLYTNTTTFLQYQTYTLSTQQTTSQFPLKTPQINTTTTTTPLPTFANEATSQSTKKPT